MPNIELKTKINAPIDRVFDLARSIDLHTKSTSKSEEKAIAGKTSGLIELGETVTWEATHLYIRQNLTSKIVAYDRPLYFRDSMQQGAFARLDHDHFFEEIDGGTLMKDAFDYDSPLWFLGYIADAIFLEDYMKQFLLERNKMIKEIAENEKWREFL